MEDKKIIIKSDSLVVQAIREYERIKDELKIFQEKEKILKEQLKNYNFETIIIELPDYKKVVNIKQYEIERKSLDEQLLMKSLNISEDEIDACKKTTKTKAIKISIK